MNILKGIIEAIREEGQLSLVSIRVGEDLMKSIIIETRDTTDYLLEGNKIKVLFKETEVIISSNADPKISLQNKLSCHIKSIQKGQLLSRLELIHSEGQIVSVITTNAAEQLGLEIGKTVLAMIKTNEVMLSK